MADFGADLLRSRCISRPETVIRQNPFLSGRYVLGEAQFRSVAVYLAPLAIEAIHRQP